MNADRVEVATLTVTLFGTLERSAAKNEAKLLALACAFVLLLKVLKASYQDTFAAVQNLMYDRVHADRMEHRFAACEMNLREDILPKGAPL